MYGKSVPPFKETLRSTFPRLPQKGVTHEALRSFCIVPETCAPPKLHTTAWTLASKQGPDIVTGFPPRKDPYLGPTLISPVKVKNVHLW